MEASLDTRIGTTETRVAHADRVIEGRVPFRLLRHARILRPTRPYRSTPTKSWHTEGRENASPGVGTMSSEEERLGFAMSIDQAIRLPSMKATNLAELYGLPLLDWQRIEARLDEGILQAPDSGGPDRHTCWLATINVDGSPHVTGVGALWVDGGFWFETGEHTRKGRNLARDRRCTLSVATHGFDLVIEGVADLITDPDTVSAMASRWAAAGWPCRVDKTGSALTAEFSAPSAGPPPWRVYRLTTTSATALETVEPGGATRRSFTHV